MDSKIAINDTIYMDTKNNKPEMDIIDDSSIFGYNPGRILKIIIICKKFIWGTQIVYIDGTSTGSHHGSMELENNPEETEELVLDQYEYIQQISGYIDQHINSICFKTNMGKFLNIGNSLSGKLFTLQAKNCIIKQIIFGYNGYLNYIGVTMGLQKPINSLNPISLYNNEVNKNDLYSIVDDLPYMTIDRKSVV